MEREVQVIPVKDLSSSEYQYLYQLNFRDKSPMQRRFSMARRGAIEGHVVICREHEKILGWCLLWKGKNDYTDCPIVYFYVKKSFRRQGIGTILFKAASGTAKKLYKKNVVVWTWDDISEKFFSNFKDDLESYC